MEKSREIKEQKQMIRLFTSNNILVVFLGFWMVYFDETKRLAFM